MERLHGETGEDSAVLSDEVLLARSRIQPWCFAELVERYEAPFTRKVRSIVYNQLDVEEVVLDTFTKIYLNADTFKPQDGAKFSSWAYRILLNTAFTRYQKISKEGKRVMALDPELEQLLGEYREHSGFHDRRDGIERILARLPGHFSAVLRLHYLERWSHQDIANHTGEQVGTIKARIHRAKAAFKKASQSGEAESLW